MSSDWGASPAAPLSFSDSAAVAFNILFLLAVAIQCQYPSETWSLLKL